MYKGRESVEDCCARDETSGANLLRHDKMHTTTGLREEMLQLASGWHNEVRCGKIGGGVERGRNTLCECFDALEHETFFHCAAAVHAQVKGSIGTLRCKRSVLVCTNCIHVRRCLRRDGCKHFPGEEMWAAEEDKRGGAGRTLNSGRKKRRWLWEVGVVLHVVWQSEDCRILGAKACKAGRPMVLSVGSELDQQRLRQQDHRVRQLFYSAHSFATRRRDGRLDGSCGRRVCAGTVFFERSELCARAVTSVSVQCSCTLRTGLHLGHQCRFSEVTCNRLRSMVPCEQQFWTRLSNWHNPHATTHPPAKKITSNTKCQRTTTCLVLEHVDAWFLTESARWPVGRGIAR